MKKIAVLCAMVALLVLAGCTSVHPIGATGNPVGSKVGEATGTLLFGVLPLGTFDTGVQAAAQNGGISSISTIDKKVVNYYFMSKVTTIVTGN